MDDIFRGVFEYVLHRGWRAVANILEGHSFAAIAALVAGTGMLCIALILIRGLGVLGIAVLCIVAGIIGWAVSTSVRRTLKDIRGLRNQQPTH